LPPDCTDRVEHFAECRGRSFVEEDASIGFDRRIVRDAVRQVVACPKRVQLSPEFCKIDGLLFQRLGTMAG
jgi:hypothetical protein